MKQIYKPILIIVSALLGSIFSLYGIMVDLPFVRPDLVKYYIAGRIISFLLMFYIFIEVKFFKKQYPLQVPFLYATLIFYCIHGQYFVPCYYIGFIQIISGFAFFFPMPKKQFNLINFFGSLGMMASIWLATGRYTTTDAMETKFKVDATFGIILIMIIIYSGYLNITLVREKQLLLSEKFLEVGRNFGDLIHGLKGQFSSPLIYTQVLKREIAKENSNHEKIAEVFTNLQKDLKALENQIKTINFISKNDNKIEEVNVKEVIFSIIETFFKNRTNNMKISYDGRENYKTNEYMVRTITVNAIKNSLENFESKNVQDPEIHVSLVDGILKFRDNGGGFSAEALKKFKKSLFYTEKENGSGLGLFLIRGTIEGFGGKMDVANEDHGAAIKIQLNKEPKT